VVPTALAIGWELVVDDRVVVVTEVHEHRVVVEHADGSKESIDVVKEDSGENAEDLEGSEYEVEEDAEE
jgi:bifunctional DNA-binding transcriptional regulator/antitoxin component of YhaV-PrlF toxin-antitoxin module